MLLPFLSDRSSLLLTGPTGNATVWQGQVHVHIALTAGPETPGHLLCARTSLSCWGKSSFVLNSEVPFCYSFEEKNSQRAFNHYPVSFSFVLWWLQIIFTLNIISFFSPLWMICTVPIILFLLLRGTTRCKKKKPQKHNKKMPYFHNHTSSFPPLSLTLYQYFCVYHYFKNARFLTGSNLKHFALGRETGALSFPWLLIILISSYNLNPQFGKASMA